VFKFEGFSTFNSPLPFPKEKHISRPCTPPSSPRPVDLFAAASKHRTAKEVACAHRALPVCLLSLFKALYSSPALRQADGCEHTNNPIKVEGLFLHFELRCSLSASVDGSRNSLGLAAKGYV